jgi:hypothetical protein
LRRRDAALLALGVAAVAALAVVRVTAGRRPVLFSFTPDPEMVRPRTYCVMNPFRDRTAEKAAERFLRELRAGRETLRVVADAERREQLAESERKWPLQTWRIGAWEEHGGRAEILYWVRRGNGHHGEEEVWLAVDRTRIPPRVVDFGAVY